MLIKLYSDTDLIYPVLFHKGINIILGKYSMDKQARGINGIGKSSLVRLIDFTLLSRRAENKFSQKKYDFLREKQHSLTLEFKVRQKKYFLKRIFSDLKTIYFGTRPDKFEKYEKSEMPKILESIFFPTENNEVFFEGKRYGTLMEFFIKDDLQNQKRTDPLNFVSYNANMRDKALYNFYLLNLPTKHLVTFNEASKDYEEKSKTVKGLTNKIKADTGKELKEFRTEKLKIEDRISVIEKRLKDYNFLESHKEIETQLTEVISQINEKSILYHAASRKLKKLTSSYSDVSDIDLEKIQSLYNEAQSTFGKFVKKELKEVIDFKKQLLANRKKYLLDEENKLKQIIDSALKAIKKLEKRRSQLLSFLKEKGALDKVEITYESLIEEKVLLEKNTGIIREIDEVEKIMADTDVVISELKRDIMTEVTQVENRLNELRRLFLDILNNAIYLDEDFDNYYFDVAANPSSKRNQLPFNINIQIPQADALGKERLKIVSYDLMVFIKSRMDSRSIPDFLIHDGIFHAISKKTIFNVLNYMYHKANEFQNFQYILTFNEDEIEAAEDDAKYGKLAFNISNYIIAQFVDTEKETLFKRFF